jgi:mannose-6-phosphate isomerase-like protein (cupin superfamily)
MQKLMRRIITGNNKDGKAVFDIDEQVPITIMPENFPGFVLTELFYTEETPQTSQTTLKIRPYDIELPKGAFRFCICQIPPLSDLIEFAKKHNLPIPSDEEDYLLHKTQSIDYLYILQGEVVLRLDSGEEKLVKAGDFIVQRATVHGWNNLTTQPCIILCVMIGVDE